MHVEKRPVLGQVDAVVRHHLADHLEILFEELRQLVAVHAAVIGHGHVHVGAPLIERADQGGRNVGQPAGLGGQVVGHVAHAVGQVGHLGGDDQDARVAGGGGHGVSSFLRSSLFPGPRGGRQAQVSRPGVNFTQSSARGDTRTVNP